MHAKESFDTAETPFQRGASVEKVKNAGLPELISPGGLSRKRQQYLYSQIRPFVKPEFQGNTYPVLH